MQTYTVSLVRFPDITPLTIDVQASSAVNACNVAQQQMPGTIAYGAEIKMS